MKSMYVIQSYLFSKRREDSNGVGYFDIIHPDGRYLDYNHPFSSESEMIAWIQNRTY